MNGDDEPAGNHGRRVKPRHVEQVDFVIFEKDRQMKVRAEAAGLSGVAQKLKIFGERADFIQVALLADQQVFIFGIEARQLQQDVAHIGADAEIARAADV